MGLAAVEEKQRELVAYAVARTKTWTHARMHAHTHTVAAAPCYCHMESTTNCLCSVSVVYFVGWTEHSLLIAYLHVDVVHSRSAGHFVFKMLEK